jgi:hypothetical protein
LSRIKLEDMTRQAERLDGSGGAASGA